METHTGASVCQWRPICMAFSAFRARTHTHTHTASSNYPVCAGRAAHAIDKYDQKEDKNIHVRAVLSMTEKSQQMFVEEDASRTQSCGLDHAYAAQPAPGRKEEN